MADAVSINMMNNPIPVPSKGDGLKATWAASVANGVNALMPMSPSGMLVRDGAGGVGCEPLPRNHRDRIVSSATLPWTFRCTVTNPGEDNETRTGGWYNARLQIGLDCKVRGFYSWTTFEPVPNLDIAGVTQTADGTYYAEVDLISHTAELKIAAGGYIPPHDYGNNKLNVYVGTVTNGVQTDGIYCIPCIYTRLD